MHGVCGFAEGSERPGPRVAPELPLAQPPEQPPSASERARGCSGSGPRPRRDQVPSRRGNEPSCSHSRASLNVGRQRRWGWPLCGAARQTIAEELTFTARSSAAHRMVVARRAVAELPLVCATTVDGLADSVFHPLQGGCMRLRITLLTVCLASLPSSLGSNISSAQTASNVIADTVRAYHEFDEASGDLEKVKGVVKDIEENRKPSVTSNEWSNLAASYEEAARAFAALPLQPQLDDSRFSVSLDELRQCGARAATLERVRGYLQHLRSVSTTQAKTIAYNEQMLRRVDASKESLTYLIDVNAKLATATYPLYNSLFAWNWFELDTSVRRSLGNLQSVLEKRKKRFDEVATALTLRISNLEGNLATLEGLQCGLAGNWSGTVTRTQKKSGQSVQDSLGIVLRSANGAWSGDAVIDGDTLAMDSLAVAGSNVSFSVRASQCSASLSADERSLVGSCENATRRYEFRLSR